MKNPIKIKDIAARANVSAGTVDRVLHNRSDVSEKTKEKVLQIIDELGYKTNIIAKTLALKKNIIFSTLIPGKDKYSSYWQKPLAGFKKAESEILRYGVNINNYFFNIGDKETFIKQAGLILEAQPDAVVIAPVFKEETLDFVSELKNKNIPFIFLDSNLEQENDSIGYVGHDSYQSGKVAARLIETRTHPTDNILLINLSANPKNQNHLSQRSNGFRDFFLTKDRIGTLVEIDITNLESSFIQDKLAHVFENISNIKAIFITSSKAHIVAKYLFEKNLQDEIILLGYDLIDKNINYLKNDTIDYLISQNPVLQGYSSIEKLFQTIVLKQKSEKNTYLPIDIVIKENIMYC